MIDDPPVDESTADDDDLRDEGLDDPENLYDDGRDKKYDDFATDIDEAYDDDEISRGEMEKELALLQRLNLDAKPEPKAIRGGSISSSVLDPFGTGELFDDESTAVASLSVLGLLLVIVVVACVYASFRQSMNVTPTNKNGASKKGNVVMPSFSKRRE